MPCEAFSLFGFGCTCEKWYLLPREILDLCEVTPGVVEDSLLAQVSGEVEVLHFGSCRSFLKGFDPDLTEPSFLCGGEGAVHASLLWQRRCGREWHCCSRSDCLYSSALLSVVAKNNPAPQDKEDRLEGGVFPFPSLLSLNRSLSSLPHQI